MRIFTVKVKNRQQEKKVRASLKLVDAEFVENSEEFFYSENLKKDIEQSRKDKKEGKTVSVDPKKLWQSIGL
mgnify:FL=1